jgi:signal transduction histidine kinase
MRKTKEPSVLAFVADADLALTTEQLDENNNGIIEPNEEVPLPGALYDGEVIPTLTQDAFLHPVTDSNITIDQWGSTISGYAPILNKTGQAVAVLGIDMDATEYINLSESIFSPVGLLLVLLAGVSVGGSILLFLWKRRLEALERLEIERSGLLRLAFHQLGGPLTIINWSLEELQEEGPRSLHRTIDNIQEGVKRLGKILRTLKEADLVHTGHIEYHPESVSLTSILQKVATDAADQLAARSQNIQLALAGDITTNLDPKLIAGVVQELLTNAVDFSPDGATIVIRSRKILGRAEFEIEDHGCGIPRRDLERLFNEFTRGSNANRYKADGNGLGLYIVRGIIRRAGGTVSIQSMEGHGTTVTVRLPMA